MKRNRLAAFFMITIIFGSFACLFGSSAKPDFRVSLISARADESIAPVYGAVDVIRAKVVADQELNIDWEIKWAEDGEEETTPVSHYFKIRPLPDTHMAVDIICYYLTNREAEISAWIHGAPHTRISKSVLAPYTSVQTDPVTNMINEIVMPPLVGSTNLFSPECETALAITKLTCDTFLSIHADGTPADGFMRLKEQTDHQIYTFEMTDPEAATPDGKKISLSEIYYYIRDAVNSKYYSALRSFPIRGLKEYCNGSAYDITGITYSTQEKVLRIEMNWDIGELTEQAFFAALNFPVGGYGEHGTSGVYMLSERKETEYDFILNHNSRLVRAGIQFPETFKILTTEQPDKLTYVGDKVFCEEELTGKERTFANGITYTFEFTNESSSWLSGSKPSSFRRALGVCLNRAAQSYSEEHNLFAAKPLYREETTLKYECSRFELQEDLTLRVGCITGYDSELVKALITAALEELNAELKTRGAGHTIIADFLEFNSISDLSQHTDYDVKLIAQKLRTFEDYRFHEWYYEDNMYGVECGIGHEIVTRDPFWQEDPDWYDNELLQNAWSEVDEYNEVYEIEFVESALHVPVLMGEGVYQLPDEAGNVAYQSYLTRHMDYLDYIACGWTRRGGDPI